MSNNIEAEILAINDIPRLQTIKKLVDERLQSLLSAAFGVGEFALVTIGKRGLGQHPCYVTRAPGGRVSTFAVVILTENFMDSRSWRVHPSFLSSLPENRKAMAQAAYEKLKKENRYLFMR